MWVCLCDCGGGVCVTVVVGVYCVWWVCTVCGCTRTVVGVVLWWVCTVYWVVCTVGVYCDCGGCVTVGGVLLTGWVCTVVGVYVCVVGVYCGWVVCTGVLCACVYCVWVCTVDCVVCV